ncbi:MAG: TonB-dependent receptor [Deltaproteobacteria bacterium]|nr:TonB-dependent receptor [Deltaproteobacteria bacterium]
MKSLKMVIAVIGILSIFLARQISFASEKEEEKVIELEEIVVTATRTGSELKDVPANVTVITREQIDASSCMRVDDVLRKYAGIDIRRSNGFIGRANVSLRGMGEMPGRTLILMDGMPMNKADTGTTNWNLFGLDDIERIEIVRGPASALYGSSAMGGVINIITRSPEDRPVSLALNSRFGSWRTWGMEGTISGKVGKLGYYISNNHLESDGYQTTPGEDQSPYDIKKDLEEDHLWTKFTYDFTDQASLSLGYLHFEDERGEGEKIYHPEGIYRSWDTDGVDLTYKNTWGKFDWLARGFFREEDYYWNRERLRRGRYTRYEVDVKRKDGGATIQTSFPRLPWGTLTTGFDYKYGSVDGKDDYKTEVLVIQNEGKQRTFSFFFNDEIKIKKRLVLNIGGRYDYTKSFDGTFSDPSGFLASRDFSDESWGEFSPRVGALYHLNESTSLRASIGKAFRAPILDDLYRNGIFRGKFYNANPDLDPETLITYEVGIDHYLTESILVRFSGYYTDAEDFFYPIRIGSDPDTGRDVFQRMNVGEVEIYGFEAEATYQINPRWSVFGNFTWNRSRIDEFGPDRTLEGNDLEYTPRVKGNIGVSFFDPKICRVELVGRYVDEMYTNSDNDEELNDYLTVDLKLSRKIGKFGEASLDIMNILDEDYEEYSDSRAPGRVIMGMITLKY